MQRASFIVLGGLGFTVGCASVPHDAPQAFHDADGAIQRMEEKDVDETLPKTAEMAEDTFDEALELLGDSREDPPASTEAVAVSKAEEAKTLAEGAIRIHDQVSLWDDNRGEFENALAMLDSAQNPVADVTIIEPGSPFAKLKGMEFNSTVAFFDTGSTELGAMNESELVALTELLKRDQSFAVQLVGYADPRGPAEYNEQLGMQRAERVAGYLRNQGIADSQIEVTSVGENEATRADSGLAGLQLERKVKAKVQF